MATPMQYIHTDVPPGYTLGEYGAIANRHALMQRTHSTNAVERAAARYELRRLDRAQRRIMRASGQVQ